MIFGFTYLVFELNTANSIKALAVKSAHQTLHYSGWTAKLDEVGSQPNPAYLGGLLYANVHAQNPNNGEWWTAGSYT